MFLNALLDGPVLLSVGRVLSLFVPLSNSCVRFNFFVAVFGILSSFALSLALSSMFSFFERMVSRFRMWLRFSFSSLSTFVFSWMRMLNRHRKSRSSTLEQNNYNGRIVKYLWQESAKIRVFWANLKKAAKFKAKWVFECFFRRWVFHQWDNKRENDGKSSMPQKPPSYHTIYRIGEDVHIHFSVPRFIYIWSKWDLKEEKYQDFHSTH